MIKKRKVPTLTLNLQLFAEGGEGGTSAEGATGVNETAAEFQISGVESLNPEGEDNGADVDLDAEFEKSIKGKYKDAFNKRTQSIVTERVKNLKGENETLNNKIKSSLPILEELSFRYGVDINDAGALLAAIKADTAYEEQKAFEEGKTLEERLKARNEAREKKKQSEELERLRRQVKANNDREAFMAKYREWDSKTDEIRSVYPSYDLRKEMGNREFALLLNSGVPPKTAYEVIHKDDIMSAAMHHAVNTASKKVADNVMANGRRPIENGNAAQSAATTKIDVSNLSPAQMDDFIRRAQRGEIITFSN